MNLQTFFPPLWEEFSSLITGRLSDNYQCWVNRSPSFPTLGHPGGCHESIHLCHTPGLQWQMSLWPFFFGSCLGSFLSVDLTRSGPAVLISHCVEFAGSALGAPEDGCLHHLFEVCPGYLQINCSCTRGPELRWLQARFWCYGNPVTFPQEDIHPSSILISFLHFFHPGLFFFGFLILGLLVVNALAFC